MDCFRLNAVGGGLGGNFPPNKACTGQVGFVAVFEHFSGFEFILLPSIVHARPPASNTNRCAINDADFFDID